MSQLEQHISMSAMVLRGNLIVTLPGDLNDEGTQSLMTTILTKANRNDVTGCIYDFSLIRVMDTYAFNQYDKASRALELMGVHVVWTGLGPGLVAAMMDLNNLTDCIQTTLTLEEAIHYLNQRRGQSF